MGSFPASSLATGWGAPVLNRVAEGTRFTSCTPHEGQPTRPWVRCAVKSSAEANQPSNRCPAPHCRSKIFMCRILLRCRRHEARPLADLQLHRSEHTRLEAHPVARLRELGGHEAP